MELKFTGITEARNGEDWGAGWGSYVGSQERAEMW